MNVKTSEIQDNENLVIRMQDGEMSKRYAHACLAASQREALVAATCITFRNDEED